MSRYTMERVYPLPPGEAWALVADTDHLNRMIGLPSVEFGPSRDLVRRARARFFGVPASWEEFPFEWVRERGYAVRRDFESGPVKRFVGGVELEPESGGTRVRVFAQLTPRNILARPLMRLVAGRGLRRTLTYCDRYVAERSDPLAPPKPASPRRVDRNSLDRALVALGRAPVDPKLVRRLEALVVRGSDDQLVRVRPYAQADEWGANRYQVLRLFFHATRAGLFDLRWELMCPACRVPKGEAASLKELPSRFHCETCRIDYEVDFEERVELRFTLRPAIREAEDAVYCVGSPMRSPHIIAQQYLAPGEVRAITLPSDGPLGLRAVGDVGSVPLSSSGTFAWSGNVWLGASHSPLTDGEDLALRIENRDQRPLLAVVERRAPDPRAATAAEVTLLQEFRDLFGAEVLAPGQEIGVATVAILFTDLQGSTALYEGQGDAPAYGSVRRHFEYLRDQVAAGGGAIVKTIGDAIMAAFPTPEKALAVALAVQEGFAAWCRVEGIVPPLVLRIGLHAGPSVAINANQRLDYFGRTVNLAARIQRQARGGEIALAAALWDEPAIRALGHEKGAYAERFEAQLPGIEGLVELVRLWLPGPEAA